MTITNLGGGKYKIDFDDGRTAIASNINYDRKMNITDQRYNDTTRINGVNTSTNIAGLGFYTQANTISTFVNRSLWTTIDNYPSACSASNYVTQIGDTLTCSIPLESIIEPFTSNE